MTQKTKNDSNRSQQMMFLIGGIIVAVVLVVILLIVFQNNSTGTFDYSSYSGPVPEESNDPNLIVDGIPRTRTSDGAFILGNPDARITVVAFEDFLCSHCQTYQATVKEFLSQYVATGQARFEFRMLPISNSSQSVFQVAECVDVVEPGMFWPVHDYLFQQASTGTLDSNSLVSGPVSEFGLSRSELINCLSTADQYVVDGQVGSQAGVTGTPTVGWRLDGGPIRFDVIPQQPTIEELGALVGVGQSAAR